MSTSDSSHFSYGRQTRHYFDRPHESPPDAPVASPAAWRGQTLASSDVWRVKLSASALDEIDAALAHARATGKPTESLDADDFPLPDLAAEIAGWRKQLDTGRGFLLVTGLPIEDLSEEDASRLFWCLGLHMGRPGTQNAHGDLLGHVRDTGEDAADPFVRLYRTSKQIAYHCDAADVVALLCLRTARTGGLSRIVSSVTVYNELQAVRPELAARLFEPMLLDIRDGQAAGALRYLPIPPCRFADGRLRTFYHSDYFRSVARHEDVGELGELERDLLDTYESIAMDPTLFLDMELQPGDIQWLSNHTILHARTGYDDYAEPERRRHLLRLWLSLD